MNYNKIYIIFIKKDDRIGGYFNDCYTNKEHAEKVATEMSKQYNCATEVEEFILKD